MAERKAVFLDVDGTLVDDRGQIPDSARRAVREARANGHLVFLCTGRALVELWPDILSIGFDGFVSAAGASVQAGADILLQRSLTVEAVRHVRDFFGRRGVDVYFQANDTIYATARVRDRLRRLIRESVTDEQTRADLTAGLFRFVDAIDVDADPLAGRITKAIYVEADVPLDELRAEFAGAFDVIPSSVAMFGPRSGEMMIPGVHKASGIDVLIEHLGIDRADTLAIGDGYNDLEMLAHVAVGIAMGSAPDPVRRAADEVTAGVDEDGVRLAFVRHGLIGA